MGNLLFFRGPLPKHLMPTDGTAERRRPDTLLAAPPQHGDAPTEYLTTAHGVLLVVNPNRCGICRRRRHPDTAHHSFEGDRATVKEARLLGWPMPPVQDELS